MQRASTQLSTIGSTAAALCSLFPPCLANLQLVSKTDLYVYAARLYIEQKGRIRKLDLK